MLLLGDNQDVDPMDRVLLLPGVRQGHFCGLSRSLQGLLSLVLGREPFSLCLKENAVNVLRMGRSQLQVECLELCLRKMRDETSFMSLNNCGTVKRIKLINPYDQSNLDLKVTMQ